MTDAPAPEKALRLTADHIAAAEALIGLEFTPAERALMLKSLDEGLDSIAALRAHELPNALPMSLYFDPRAVLPATVPPLPRIYNVSPQPLPPRPADLEALAFAPLTTLAALVQSRQVTATELTAMYLARLKRYDPALHCVVTLTEDLAYEQAARADADIAAGHYRGPLHGIPWGAKDLLATRRYPTTWGAEPYQTQHIDYDATVVQRLEEAGAVLVAKLSLGALAYGDLWFGGRTRNPWNTAQGSSGSSAGSAAAVAAGLVGFAIGTETYGSIVSPATRCGVTGLRPTFGRVSRAGAMALSWSLDKIGPLARSVEDCALIFTAIYGPDGTDRSVVAAPFEWQPDFNPRGLRVGYLQAAFEAAYPHKDNDARALAVLRDLGFDLKPVTLPAYQMPALLLMLLGECAAAFDTLTRSNADDQLAWQDAEAWPNTFRTARFLPAVDYINAARLRVRLMEAMAALMQTVDIIVAPSFGGDVLPITNLTGHPAVVLPNGFNADGTPTSLSFIGALDHEAALLAFAKAYQDATDFHRHYPALSEAPTPPLI